MPEEIVRRRKRSFPFGSISELLRHHGSAIRERILGARAMRRLLPGLESWLDREPSSFRGPWEGTLWALLALAEWCEAAGIT